MSLKPLTSPTDSTLGARFALVSYLPTVGCTIFLLVLISAGAPGERLDFSSVWHATNKLSAAQVILLALGVTLTAVISHPYQLSLVRLLEGVWSGKLRWWGTLRSRRHRTLRGKLDKKTIAEGNPPAVVEVNRAGQALSDLISSYPPLTHPTVPTALGNALASMEARAGSAYGLDAVAAWPRLFPLLPDKTKATVDQARDTLDAAVRFSVTAALTGVATFGLLSRTGWWLLLTLIPVFVSWMAYRASVHAARNYGVAVTAAFDLHRFDLYAALRVPHPADTDAEREFNVRLSTHWRQGTPFPHLSYPGPDVAEDTTNMAPSVQNDVARQQGERAAGQP